MNTTRRFIIPALAVAAVIIGQTSVAWAISNDRQYQMGDDPFETASNGAAISTTFDSAGQTNMNQLHDLVASGSPVYRTYTGRPDGNNSLGAEFNGTNQYLRSARFGLPETTVSSVQSTTLNYLGIADRGLQFWVRPDATNAQSLVMDTNEHGARINASGNFSMRYAGEDFDSAASVTPGTWYHVMVVRPEGPGGGSQMYVDGVAVAAAPGGYDGADTAELVVGSNTDGDDDPIEGEGFTGGDEEFFDGIIDDLELFVIGESVEDPGVLPEFPVEPGVDFGDFDFQTDNAFAAFTLAGTVPGDVDNNGTFNNDDVTDFINGWMSVNLVNGIQVGDLNSRANGDLNIDGTTDISDLAIIQGALVANGMPNITASQLGVPEPSTVALLLAALAAAPLRVRWRC